MSGRSRSRRRWSRPTVVALTGTLVLGGLLAAVPAAESRRRGRNLVKGGDFERGDRKSPAGWQRPDGLTSFWVKADRKHGRSIRIDTDVLNSQFRAREDEMQKALEEKREPAPPPTKKPTRPPKYDTVAGNDGVHFVSDRIPIDPAKHYRLEVDARVEGKAAPKVWIKGYARIRSRGGVRDRIVWKKALDCVGADREWSTFTTVFPRTTRIPARVEYVRIQLYPYWPPAVYWFDNVRLTEIDREEAERYDVDRDRQRR